MTSKVINTAGPETVEQNPIVSIQIGQPDSRSLAALKNVQLMTQSYDLEPQGRSTPEAGNEPWIRERRIVRIEPMPRTITTKRQEICARRNLWEGQDE